MGVVDTIDLSGAWRAAEADEASRRALVESDFDSGEWEQVTIPGHWRTHRAFADSDGPVVHHRRFTASTAPGRRAWLIARGVHHSSEIWLDGDDVGATTGSFVPHRFEVTDALTARSEHSIAMEVVSTPEPDLDMKRAVTGLWGDATGIARDWNPGGIWGPVEIVETGPISLTRTRVVCASADPERARLEMRLILDSDTLRDARVRVSVRPADSPGMIVAESTEIHPLAAGPNEITQSVVVRRPRLWWPTALGDQPLYDLEIVVSTADGDTESDRHVVRTGIRTVTADDLVFSINGERVFLKGVNLYPTSITPAYVSDAAIEADLDLAVEAGFDLVRVYAHVAPTHLYREADRRGLLVWQDFPLQHRYARTVRPAALRLATRMVDELAHHPSIIVWCAHNEPTDTANPRPGEAAGPLGRARRIAAQQMPEWNKSVLDRRVRRMITRADGTRPVITHSGVWPPLLGDPSHLWLGWGRGSGRDLAALARRFPISVRFVAAMGAQSVPADGVVRDGDPTRALDWDALESRFGAQRHLFERYVPPGDHSDIGSWAAATRDYQAALLRRHIEELRRLRFSPTGGFCVHYLADAQPAVSCSLLDADRRPKAAYAAVREANRPVIVVADRLPATANPGDTVAVDVHVVNDTRAPLTEGRVTARLVWPGGAHEQRWTGPVEPDTVARVGTLSWVVPATPGPATLELTLRVDGADLATNGYRCEIGHAAAT
ncbi:MAG: hypothetical protein RIE08_18470 [Acidimicrobiales bacterium]